MPLGHSAIGAKAWELGTTQHPAVSAFATVIRVQSRLLGAATAASPSADPE